MWDRAFVHKINLEVQGLKYMNVYYSICFNSRIMNNES